MRDDQQILEEARERVIQSIADNMDLYGITDSIGRLYGTLYFSDRALTLDEMRESLGMSKTSMSTGVRTLLDTKMVHKVWKKGVRKDLYQAEGDWYKTFFDFFSTKWKRAIEINLAAIEKSKQDYSYLIERKETIQEIRELAQLDLKKLEEAESYYFWLEKLIDTFESGEIFKLIPKIKDNPQK
ncbi:GbsR/MarR family transcriptional regulator [Tepidibacillus infernus]|uniref:HTH-type transcriptional regulator n=1 Tax=Tepidibacillus decaturensis TaxID=1413211 RepID=A0A135L4D9_9BACI|nr:MULTISPECIES: GbsR/MarR family transcriptional regulator [Tepidibacillus]KXG43713.1 transcriptional regulator [Tepidibacillus decaturensis]GBF12194.1 HTH-type transcriptional repressor OpcR [Tepidibacillus sp. HK-1]